MNVNKGYTASDKAPTKGYGSPLASPSTLSLTDKELPDIKKWGVGKTYNVTLEIKMTGMNKYSVDEPMRANFDVVSAEVAEPDDDEDTDD